MKTMMKTALFGGTLMAAGLSAQAQEFVFDDVSSYAVVGAGYYNLGGLGMDASNTSSDAGGFNFSATSSVGGTTTTSSRDATSFRIESVWDGVTGLGGYFNGFTDQYFQVTQDAYITVSWDFSTTDYFGPPAAGWFGANIPGGGAAGFFAEADSAANASGSVTFTLDAGVDYNLFFNMGAPFSFDSSPKFFEASLSAIPAPGSAALIGMAGLVGLRRRR